MSILSIKNIISDPMTQFTSFQYWFHRNANNVFSVYYTIDLSTEIGKYDENDSSFTSMIEDADVEAIRQDFDHWKLRPEYQVGKYQKLENATLSDLVDLYMVLLSGSYLVKQEKSTASSLPVSSFSRMETCLSWLEHSDFFQAPASSIYHDAYIGGLLVHSLRVYNEAIMLTQHTRFNMCDLASVTMVSLVHDWCKIGLYESYEKNVKNDTTGQWEKVKAYRRGSPAMPLGHGAASLYAASKFFPLSLEEACSIRWHMGEYNVANNEMNELHCANEKYPLVQLLQFADRLSIVSY